MSPSPLAPRRRYRWVTLTLLAIVIAAGLASRRFGGTLPSFVAEYAGDTLWATTAYLALALLLPRVPILRLVVGALAVAERRRLLLGGRRARRRGRSGAREKFFGFRAAHALMHGSH
jgi:hypothetical protein